MWFLYFLMRMRIYKVILDIIDVSHALVTIPMLCVCEQRILMRAFVSAHVMSMFFM